ncbi:hypothetical protein MKEN_00776700 [Mycena kentingensis (nom. inval.)]|nr:hypothetical protein MKEN_00776700 [Mycena kentingensis (nom. inval.)]
MKQFVLYNSIQHKIFERADRDAPLRACAWPDLVFPSSHCTWRVGVRVRRIPFLLLELCRHLYMISPFAMNNDWQPPSPRPLPPKAPILRSKLVQVLHPGYSNRPRFLVLPANELAGRPCIPRYILLDACAVLANNVRGRLRSISSEDDVPAYVPSGTYLYFTDDFEANPQYPLCLSFHAWTPHKLRAHLPEHWRSQALGTGHERDMAEEDQLFALLKSQSPAEGNQMSSESLPQPTAVSSTSDPRRGPLDPACAITQEISRLQNAHLVPNSEKQWWSFHDLDSCLFSPHSGPDQPCNLLSVRADLNDPGMDQGHFVFVPYDKDAPYSKAAVTFFISDGLPDLAFQYHCRAVEIPTRIDPICLFSRFAWGIFEANSQTLESLQNHPVGIVRVHVPTTLQEIPLSRNHGEFKGRVEDFGSDDEVEDAEASYLPDFP